jgi:hypothetical protein
MNQTFIIAAYSLTWAVMLGYLALLLRKSAGSRKTFDRIAAQSRGENLQ